MSDSNSSTLDLPLNMTIGECFEIKKQMIDMLQNNDFIKLDASKVERIDAAGLQLILSFILAKDKNNMKSQASYSDVILESAKMLGVIDLLDRE